MTALRSPAGRLWLAFAAAVVLAVSLGAWALVSRPGTPALARQYLTLSACLLTPQTGVSAGSAAQAWASMESASRTTHVMVSYLVDTGPADVPVMLNTLIARQCRLIVTAGADPGPVISAARAYPGERFLIVTTAELTGRPTPGNLTTASLADAPARVKQAFIVLAATV